MSKKQLLIEIEKFLKHASNDPVGTDPGYVVGYIQENNALFRRYKKHVLVKLVAAILQERPLKAIKESNSMNQCLHQLYKKDASMNESEPSAVEREDSSALRRIKATTHSEKGSNDVAKCRRRTRKGSMTEEKSARLPLSPPVTPEEKLPDFDLSSLGGIEKIVQEVRHLVIRPLKYPQVYEHLGVLPPLGVLIHGPPGSGKTKLALAVAGEAQVPFFKISAPELIMGLSGESEQKIRELFYSAKRHAPSLIFIDEIDILCPKRENAGREMERRIVAQLGTCMDDLKGSFVIVMGATNRADALDPMIRRNGRFDKEIAMGLPDEDARQRILKSLTSSIRLDPVIDFQKLGKLTPGFVGADLESVIKEAALLCIDRIFKTVGLNNQTSFTELFLSGFCVTEDDFIQAVSRVQPSAKREGFATCPDVCWDDVGGLGLQRKELEDQICHPIRESRLYEKLGICVPAGILLYGPPGCGKTLLAKAVACESGANFISVKGPELLNKYVGESERAIRQVFQRARMSAPCIIFFDELDSLCSRRGSDGHPASERVVNQLLTEMDGVENRHHVFVVAATNRPELIDPAMLRPGRLDRLRYVLRNNRLVYVPLPNTEKRADILRRLSRKTPIGDDVDLNYVASLLEGFSGADLSAVLRQAVLFLLEEYRDETRRSGHAHDALLEQVLDGKEMSLRVEMRHFLKAVSTVRASVTKEHRLHYEAVYHQINN